jgi:hypothetical protein
MQSEAKEDINNVYLLLKPRFVLHYGCGRGLDGDMDF